MVRRLKEIARLFFKLGCLAFGGPAAHIALMEEEVVSKRGWMTREHFLDLVGATNLIPGPNSTEMAIHCGFHRGGWPGLITAGLCFILPAALITGTLGFLYARYGALPEIEPFVYGIRPAVLAVIAAAIYKLGRKALKSIALGVLGLGVVIASRAGVNEIIAILAGGVFGMLWLTWRGRNRGQGLPASSLVFFRVGNTSALHFDMLAAAMPAAVPLSLSRLFLVFLKVGSVLFGSGYVLVAYLEDELIRNLGWLTQSQLLDAIAIGQFTPGPVLTTATFIGVQIGGLAGGILATLGIFTPAFIFVAIVNPLIPRLRRSRPASNFLDAVNMAAVGLMLAVTIKLGYAALVDWKTALIAGLSVLAVFGMKKINTAGIILASAVLGYILHFV